jgi:Cu-processing system ATP-binding protein
MIEATQLTKRYGELVAVDGVSLRLERGELFGLIGHNGAGKSTLIRMMLGLESPSSGEVRIDGRPASPTAWRNVRRRLGYLPENVVFYENLSGRETLEFFADLKGAARTDCARVLETVGLAAAADRRVKGYSKGMRQRLGFAQALLGEPGLLFLDEPTNGLDPQGIRDFYAVLAELQSAGVTIVLTSHILSEIQERVGRLAIMKNGHVHATGTVQAMREAMGLPLWVDVRFVVGAESALRSALDPIARCELQVAGQRLSVRCPRDAKIRVLQSLAALGPLLTDLQLREASLEDVLLGQPA